MNDFTYSDKNYFCFVSLRVSANLIGNNEIYSILIDLDILFITIICYPYRIVGEAIIILYVLVDITSRIAVYTSLLFLLLFYSLIPRIWQWNVFFSLHLAVKVDASQLLNAVWMHVEIADYDIAHVVATLTYASEKVTLEVLQHLIVILPKEVSNGNSVLQVRGVALHFVVNDNDIFDSATT